MNYLHFRDKIRGNVFTYLKETKYSPASSYYFTVNVSILMGKPFNCNSR